MYSLVVAIDLFSGTCPANPAHTEISTCGTILDRFFEFYCHDCAVEFSESHTYQHSRDWRTPVGIVVDTQRDLSQDVRDNLELIQSPWIQVSHSCNCKNRNSARHVRDWREYGGPRPHTTDMVNNEAVPALTVEYENVPKCYIEANKYAEAAS